MSDTRKPPNPPPHAAPPRARRRRLWWLGGAAALLALALAPAGLVRLVAVDDPPDAADPPPACAAWDGEGVTAHAAAEYRAGRARAVLVFNRAPGRVESLGLLVPRPEAERRVLRERGVPDADVELVGQHLRSDWDAARALGDWLRRHPGARATAVAPRFRTRRLRVLLDRTLGPDAAQVSVAALPDPRTDAPGWWRRGRGLLFWYQGALGLGYVALAGEGEPGRVLDLDELEGGRP